MNDFITSTAIGVVALAMSAIVCILALLYWELTIAVLILAFGYILGKSIKELSREKSPYE